MRCRVPHRATQNSPRAAVDCCRWSKVIRVKYEIFQNHGAFYVVHLALVADVTVDGVDCAVRVVGRYAGEEGEPFAKSCLLVTGT